MKTETFLSLCNNDGMRCLKSEATHYLANVKAEDGSTQTIIREITSIDRLCLKFINYL